MVTAGGSHLCVWDVLSGGKLLQKLTNFQKTVTCVRLSPLAGPDSAAAPRMLAGSLDGHVKIFELDSFKVGATGGWLGCLGCCRRSCQRSCQRSGVVSPVVMWFCMPGRGPLHPAAGGLLCWQQLHAAPQKRTCCLRSLRVLTLQHVPCR